jgi:hypothetical protein
MSVYVGETSLEIRLSWVEKVGAAHGSFSVPLSAITGVEVMPDGLAAVRGLRAPGLGLPGARMLGTWRGKFGKEFVNVRRGEAAVRITLAGQPFNSLLIGAEDPVALAERLTVHA